MLKFRFFVFLILSSVLFINSAVAEEQRKRDHIKIAAGSILEGYYFIGLKLCKYISESNKNIRCEVVPTTGSLENIGLLHNGEVDFAFTQGNLAVDAYNGKGYFVESEPFKEMAQLITLHDEAFTVIVKDKDKILLFGDLDGKKISNGPKNSDSTLTYVALSSYYDFKKEPEDIEMAHEDYAKNFCDGKIDAIIMMTGHPSVLVNYITHTCESDFISIENDKIDMLVQQNPAFRKHVIDHTDYPGINRSENTVAAATIFVTNGSVPKELINNFMAHFKDNIEQFKQSDPLLNDLNKDHFTSNFVLPAFKSE